MNPELAQVTNQLKTALRHAQQLYGNGQPTAAPTIRRRRNPVRRVRRRWRRGGSALRSPSGSAQRAVQAALHVRGIPYVWGGKDPKTGLDCSGLTRYAWSQAGVQLGGDTYTQIHQGAPVPYNQVAAGDLIFSNFDSRGPGHVQLAISPTQVVEAQQSGVPVKVSPMPTSYEARRPG